MSALSGVGFVESLVNLVMLGRISDIRKKGKSIKVVCE